MTQNIKTNTNTRDAIEQALKTAIKQEDIAGRRTLRLMYAAIKDHDIAMRSDGGAGDTSEAQIQGILAKMVKQREESAQMYEEGGRLELAQGEREEIEIIKSFLPRQLNHEETRTAVLSAIEDIDAASIRDMGRVMKQLKGRYGAQMNFSEVGELVKNALSQQ